MNIIFDRKTLQDNRDKRIKSIIECPYFQQSAEDIIERLSFIDKNFFNILDLGCRTGHLTKLLVKKYKNAIIIAADSSINMLGSFFHTQKLLMDEEQLPDKKANNFDLITFSLGLHWINDVQKFLWQIRLMLKPDGLFIGNFIGGNSFRMLKTKFIEAETSIGRGSSQHISPFINFDHVTPLFGQAGFKEIIVDYDNIKLKYSSPLELIRELKNIGETGALNKKTFYGISKQMLTILNDSTKLFHEQVKVISFIASPSKNSIKLTL